MRLLTFALGAVTVLTMAAGGEPPRSSDGLSPEITLLAQARPARLGVDGVGITGLFPGARRQVALVVANPYRFPITVRAVSGRLVGTSRKSCVVSSRNLVVGRYAGTPRLPLRIAAGKRVRIGHLPVQMPGTVANGCQGTTFVLRLSVTAGKAPK